MVLRERIYGICHVLHNGSSVALEKAKVRLTTKVVARLCSATLPTDDN